MFCRLWQLPDEVSHGQSAGTGDLAARAEVPEKRRQLFRLEDWPKRVETNLGGKKVGGGWGGWFVGLLVC